MVSPTDLTKLTVNLVPAAADALVTAAGRTRLTRTDTVNRALQVYALLTGMALGELLTIDSLDGEAEPLTLLRTSNRRRAQLLGFGALLIVLAFAAGVALGRRA